MENNELELTPIDQYQQFTKIESNLVKNCRDYSTIIYGSNPDVPWSNLSDEDIYRIFKSL